MRETPALIAVTPVKAGREAEFEAFVQDVIVPAVQQARPHLTGMWQTVRPALDQPSDGPPAYVFLFYGGAPISDWDLETLLPAAYGDEEGAERFREFVDFEDGQQTIYFLGGEVGST